MMLHIVAYHNMPSHIVTQALLSTIESRHASGHATQGARPRVPSAGGARKSAAASDPAASIFERDADRLGEVVEALLALQGHPGMLGHGRAKLSRPSSRGGASDGAQGASRPSSRTGGARHPALQVAPTDNTVRSGARSGWVGREGGGA